MENEVDDKVNEVKKTPPVVVGEQLENMEVISEGKRNDGVCKFDGYIIFVEGAKKGETINIEITKVLPRFALGRKIEVEE